MPIFSKEVERHCLSGLIRHPDVVAEVDSFVSAGDFYNDVHKTIFCVVRDSFLAGDKIDQVLQYLTWVRFTVAACTPEGYSKIDNNTKADPSLISVNKVLTKALELLN